MLWSEEDYCLRVEMFVSFVIKEEKMFRGSSIQVQAWDLHVICNSLGIDTWRLPNCNPTSPQNKWSWINLGIWYIFWYSSWQPDLTYFSTVRANFRRPRHHLKVLSFNFCTFLHFEVTKSLDFEVPLWSSPPSSTQWSSCARVGPLTKVLDPIRTWNR